MRLITFALCALLAVAGGSTASPSFADDAPAAVNLSSVSEHIRASVLVAGCSGTVVRKGEKWAGIVTASHCFRGFIGGQCDVYFVDGSQTTAKLLAVDRTRDLAELSIPASSVLGVAPVCSGIPDRARYDAIGWPGNRSPRLPVFFTMHPDNPPVLHGFAGEQYFRYYTRQGGPSYWKSYDHLAPFPGLPDRWAFRAEHGGIVPGVSGCGLFANGLLVGTCSNNNGHNVATQLVCSPPDQLLAFLSEAETTGKCDAWQMGPWSAPAVNFANAPPDPRLPSNRPIVFHRGELPILFADNAPQTAPPPPDARAGQTGEVDPDMKAPVPPELSAEIYSGHGKKPADLKTIKKRTHELDLVRHKEAATEARLIALEQKVAELERQPGPKGEPGPAGQDGNDGKDFTPPPVIKPKPTGHPVVAVLAFVGVIVAGLVLDFRVRATAK